MKLYEEQRLAILERPELKDIQSQFHIAQCNNFSNFYELLEELVAPVVSLKIATDEEVDKNFN